MISIEMDWKEEGDDGKIGVTDSEHSGMGVMGMNAMQVDVCPDVRLGMTNACIPPGSGEVGEEGGVRTGGAKGAVIRETGATLDQIRSRECGPRGER